MASSLYKVKPSDTNLFFEDVAEEVVVEESNNGVVWLSNHAIEEVIVGSNTDDDGNSQTEQFNFDEHQTTEIPLNDESYATYHPFPCDFCSRRFKKKANLMNHMVAHQTQRPHGCMLCSSRFMRKCDLVNHQKIHSYQPNRLNRSDADDTRSVQKRATQKKFLQQTSPLPPSPSADSSSCLKPTNYADEDVQLLLEMTKLRESSQRSENDASQAVKKEVMANKSPPFVGNDERPYACKKCGRCFARESALVSHSQMHARDSVFDCPKCGSRFFTMETLREHSLKRHGTPYTGYTSSENEEDNSEDGEGDRAYTGDERFGSFDCESCSMSFDRQDLLDAHEKSVHMAADDYSGLYNCNTCKMMFITPQKLLEHLDECPSCVKHTCMLCGSHFINQTSIQKHIKETHSQELTPTTCLYCGKTLKDHSKLKQHFWIHFSDKRHACKVTNCRKRFLTRTRLRRHIISHALTKKVPLTPSATSQSDVDYDDSFSSSTQQPRRTNQNPSYNSHSSRNNSDKRFVCGDCGKTFGSRSSQQIHIRIHTGERPYGCRHCWKAFADGGTLRKHERIHTGEKPYGCVVCTRAFNQRVVLREHIRSHHSMASSHPGYATPVFICPVCSVVTSNAEELALHIVKHSDEKTQRDRNKALSNNNYGRRRRRVPQTNRSSSQRKSVSDVDDDDDYILSDEEVYRMKTDCSDFDDDKFNDADDDRDNDYNYQARSKEGRERDRRRIGSEESRVDEEDEEGSARGRGRFLSSRRDVRSPNKFSSARSTPRSIQNSRIKRFTNTTTKTPIEAVKKAKMINTTLKPNIITRPGKRGRPRKSTIMVRSLDVPESNQQAEPVQDLTIRIGRPRTKNVKFDQNQKQYPVATFPIQEIPNGREEISGELSDNILEDGEHICNICKQQFNSKADLLYHVPVHI